MANPPPPTQASSKTVTSIAIPFLQIVLDLNPTFQRDKHDELFYPFNHAGHRARDFYGDPYVSGAYAPAVSGAPVNTALPAITGMPIVGQTLTVAPGTYNPAATSFAYRWFRNNVPIIGAVSAVYTPVIADAGRTITAGETPVNAVGAGTEAVSAGVGPVTFVSTKLAEDGTLNYHYCGTTQSIMITAGTVLKFSVKAKPAERSFIDLISFDGVQTPFCSFDLVHGVVGTPQFCTGAIIPIDVNGWYKASISFTMQSTGLTAFQVPLNPTDSNTFTDMFYQGTSGLGVFLNTGVFTQNGVPTTINLGQTQVNATFQ